MRQRAAGAAVTLLAVLSAIGLSPAVWAADGPTATPIAARVTATPALSATPAASSPTPAASATPVASPTPAASATPAGSPTPAASATPAGSPTPAASATPAGSPTPVASPTPVDPYRDVEDRLAVLVGRARLDAGLLPLARSGALDRAAVAHAQDMAARGYMEHEGLDGSTPASRAAAEGYTTPPGGAWLVVEAISAQTDQPEGPIGWWLSDGLHRRVVLRATWREVGIGYAPGGPYGRFWVALFGCRPNVLPPVLMDGVLAIPDESCGRSADAFGRVDSVQVGETTAAAQQQPWQPYNAELDWPAGRPAVVRLRDTSGQELEMRAADPTGATP